MDCFFLVKLSGLILVNVLSGLRVTLIGKQETYEYCRLYLECRAVQAIIITRKVPKVTSIQCVILLYTYEAWLLS